MVNVRNIVLIFFALLNVISAHPDDGEVTTGLSISAKKFCCDQ